jgi:outer membrane receptor protein involved in Fe transport
MKRIPSAVALTVASLVFTAGQSTLLQAQPAASDDGLETVVVTGSRIQRDPNSVAPLPISSLDEQTLRSSGATDPTAVLREIPALISSGTVADSIERGGGGVGQATLNLRQLGSNRTLVVVDGYRHVSGVAGSQTVDVSTIPSALIKRVDVLTGGASAIYGADAVTGVVNYVMRDDFEGVALDFQPGISAEGDGESYRLEGTFGRNFFDGRSNLTISAGYTKEEEIALADRSFTVANGRANNSTTYPNPARRFQQGDINPATMPNFSRRFSLSSGRFPWGFAIPTPAQIATLFPGGITPAEQALVDRAAVAPLFVIRKDPRFAISSFSGVVNRADFDVFNLDINNNGVPDCDESYIGFAFAGCYVTTPGGGVRVFKDGLISSGANQFGGDGAEERPDDASLIPGSERYYLNLRGKHAFSDSVQGFADIKYVRNKAISRSSYLGFFDLLYIAPDNPYVPAVLQRDANEAGGLLVTRDFTDLTPGIAEADRETVRVVAGLRGQLANDFSYEIVANHGRTEIESVSPGMLYDRLFAALDVVRGPNGQPVCRSDINRNAVPSGSDYFPVIAAGFFTFTPGDGSCRPANIFGGPKSVSEAAANWISTTTTDRSKLEQTVLTGSIAGDMPLVSLPGGPIQFVLGAEYREEKSSSVFDDLRLGKLPAGGAAGAAGTFIGDISPNQSVLFDGQGRVFNSGGKFDVSEAFVEVLFPLLRDAPLAKELTLSAAGRYAEYSTVGEATTWNVNTIWAPIEDLRIRGTYSRAIRAPNIAELFDPQQPTVFRPADPCNESTIQQLLASNDPSAQNRLKNCRADGIPAGYEDPLTARFAGSSGGNPDLFEEAATSWSAGFVLQPRFVPNLVFSADYYAIEIEDAIAAVSAQNIVNTCYDLPTFPNQFCGQFTRNRTAGSPTFLGLNFLRQTQLNSGRIETSGVDAQLNYGVNVAGSNFSFGLSANWTEKLDRFFDPVRTDLVNPGLLENSAPEWAGTASLGFNRGPLTLSYRMQYLGKQAIASAIQIERINTEFGPAGFADPFYVHNVSGSYEWSDQVTVYGGINNLTDEAPFIASRAYPVSGMGRFYFLGARVNLGL